MKLVNIGFGNCVNADRIIALLSPDSAPVKRIIGDCKEKGTLIDASQGRKTRTVLIMDNDEVVLSYLQPETLTQRINGEEAEDNE